MIFRSGDLDGTVSTAAADAEGGVRADAAAARFGGDPSGSALTTARGSSAVGRSPRRRPDVGRGRSTEETARCSGCRSRQLRSTDSFSARGDETAMRLKSSSADGPARRRGRTFMTRQLHSWSLAQPPPQDGRKKQCRTRPMQAWKT